MGAKNNRFFISCGPQGVPKINRSDYRQVVTLNSFPLQNNVNLKYQNISRRLAQNIPPIVLDILEVGSYIYCADQACGRGGDTWRGDGKRWIRNLHFNLPVREPDRWNNDSIKETLAQTLGFLSDDTYEFEFEPLADEIPQEQYFDFEGEHSWFNAESVLLFSGGLDSLAGTIDEILNQGHKVALVSHRPVAKISRRQQLLLDSFHGPNRTKSRKYLHIPVWVNKEAGLSRDADQRARSFLYTMLGAAVAKMLGLNVIKFYENGIVSSNLPISGQIIGGRASRSTHPKVLDGFSKLLSSLFGHEFLVENPYFWKTKSEVVEVIKNSGRADLIEIANSCSHTRSTNRLKDHCGTCTQCIERRVAITFNGLEDHDPLERYKTDVFRDQLKPGLEKTMVESYVRHGKILEAMTADEFFQQFGEAYRLLPYLGMTTFQGAELLWDLHHRHGQQFLSTMENQIRLQSPNIARFGVAKDSLMDMLLGRTAKQTALNRPSQTFPTPEGTRWNDISIEIKSNDSARVSAGGVTQIYTAFDMGFRDNRKRDLPNNQWAVLMRFAEHNGQLKWDSEMGYREERSIYKQIDRLKKTLRQFFSVDSAPIHNYTKRDGYMTKFQIFDSRY